MTKKRKKKKKPKFKNCCYKMLLVFNLRNYKKFANENTLGNNSLYKSLNFLSKCRIFPSNKS